MWHVHEQPIVHSRPIRTHLVSLLSISPHWREWTLGCPWTSQIKNKQETAQDGTKTGHEGCTENRQNDTEWQDTMTQRWQEWLKMTESHKAPLEKNYTHIYKIVLLTLSPPKGEIDFNFLTTNCNFVHGIIFLTWSSGLLAPTQRELLLRVASLGTADVVWSSGLLAATQRSRASSSRRFFGHRRTTWCSRLVLVTPTQNSWDQRGHQERPSNNSWYRQDVAV